MNTLSGGICALGKFEGEAMGWSINLMLIRFTIVPCWN